MTYICKPIFFLRFGRSLRPRVFKTILLKHFEHVTLLHDLQQPRIHPWVSEDGSTGD